MSFSSTVKTRAVYALRRASRSIPKQHAYYRTEKPRRGSNRRPRVLLIYRAYPVCVFNLCGISTNFPTAELTF